MKENMFEQYDINEAFIDVRHFNDIAGAFDKVDDGSIDLQLSLIFEELTETIDAFEANDKVEVLDGACDLFVTVAGLLFKLSEQGYNVLEAIERVNRNNLSKFPAFDQKFDYPEGCTLEANHKYSRYVIKDANGKVKKPIGFVPVDLSDLVPEGVK